MECVRQHVLAHGLRKCAHVHSPSPLWVFPVGGMTHEQIHCDLSLKHQRNYECFKVTYLRTSWGEQQTELIILRDSLIF
jgi:hypothetical protein